jgi:threonine/homoserine/homoserine lactone efflux protein
MLNPHQFGLFVIAALVLLLTPGPSVLYITTRSIDQGRRAGFASVFGNELGVLILAVSAAAGLSAILTSSIAAFNIIKYLGAAYLIYLGIRRLLSKDDPTTTVVQHKSLFHIFIQGTCVAVLNPKTALFLLAFLPQFTDVSRGGIWQQSLLLGLTFVGLAICTDSMYVLLASTAGNWLKRKGALQWGQRYVSGGIYLTLGVICACSGYKKN